ncbi:MAG: chemotaxis protein CheX [Magnetococcales bacterium]|nr:chemotaxis protein CheX [Magnetococcales bacterium]
MNETSSETNKEKILEALRVSVVEIMSTMAMSEVIYTGRETVDNFYLSKEVCGLVRIGGAHEGMIAISCNLELLGVIVSSIVGLSVDELQRDDLLDGAAELANMVGGGMKTKAQIPGVALSPPMSIIGGDYMAEWKTLRATEILTFQMELGILQIHASL